MNTRNFMDNSAQGWSNLYAQKDNAKSLKSEFNKALFR